jgi:predicted nucleic acid-binding protein
MAVERVFLDANVLFSAAWRDDSGLQSLWRLRRVRLVTSLYAADEARRNLDTDEQRQRLERVLKRTELIDESTSEAAIPPEVTLPDKDVPILQAAIESKVDFLLTGDLRHFGPYLGQTIAGVMILRPAEYLRLKRKRNSKE